VRPPAFAGASFEASLREAPQDEVGWNAMGVWLYILLCADGSYYVGTTRGSLDHRIAEHQAGTFGGYTARRRPVKLMYQQQFQRITDAIAAERRVKGWRREKKEALIRGDFELLPALSRRNHLIEAAKAALKLTSS
jgi:putative endonuclease